MTPAHDIRALATLQRDAEHWRAMTLAALDVANELAESYGAAHDRISNAYEVRDAYRDMTLLVLAQMLCLGEMIEAHERVARSAFEVPR